MQFSQALWPKEVIMTATQTQKIPFSAMSSLTVRIKWAHDQKDEPLWPNGPTPMEYVKGLPRATGSFVVNIDDLDTLTAFFGACDRVGWKDVTNDLPEETVKPGHTYYQCPVPVGFDARQAVCQAGKLTDAQLAQVRVAKGAHGHELVFPGEPIQAHLITLIEDSDGVVTWFPGNPTPPMNLHLATVKFTR